MYKINEIVNKFLLAGDKFMPEMHLRQPQFVYSACGPFTKIGGGFGQDVLIFGVDMSTSIHNDNKKKTY